MSEGPTLVEVLEALGETVPEHWPAYTLSQDPHAARELWERIGEHLGVRYVTQARQLGHLRAELSAAWDDAAPPLETLETGVIPLQRHREHTAAAYTVGVTYHPELASPRVHLCPPALFEELLEFARPFAQHDESSALLSVTRTRDGLDTGSKVTGLPEDDPARLRLLPEQARALRMLTLGVETLRPQDAIVMAEAQALIPETMQRTQGIIPYKVDDDTLWVMMTDVHDAALLERLRGPVRGREFRIAHMEEDDAHTYWQHLDHARTGAPPAESSAEDPQSGRVNA